MILLGWFGLFYFNVIVVVFILIGEGVGNLVGIFIEVLWVIFGFIV